MHTYGLGVGIGWVVWASRDDVLRPWYYAQLVVRSPSQWAMGMVCECGRLLWCWWITE